MIWSWPSRKMQPARHLTTPNPPLPTGGHTELGHRIGRDRRASSRTRRSTRRVGPPPNLRRAPGFSVCPAAQPKRTIGAVRRRQSTNESAVEERSTNPPAEVEEEEEGARERERWAKRRRGDTFIFRFRPF